MPRVGHAGRIVARPASGGKERAYGRLNSSMATEFLLNFESKF
jgi:hypothetical protein